MSEDIPKKEAESPDYTRKEALMPEGMTMKKSTFKKFLIGLVAALVISAFLGGFLVGGGEIGISPPEPLQPAQQAQPAQPTERIEPIEAERILVSLGDDPVKGDLEAPVTIVEFSDYQCPFCSRFFRNTLPQIQQDYIDTGKVKLVYRDFPLDSIHPNAIPAAMASECAHEQGEFWSYHDKLFGSQQEWASLSKNEVSNSFKDFAIELGLDSEQWSSCYDSGKYLDEILDDYQEGIEYGTRGTPGFFIGNEEDGSVRIAGAQPYSVFQQIIDIELAG